MSADLIQVAVCVLIVVAGVLEEDTWGRSRSARLTLQDKGCGCRARVDRFRGLGLGSVSVI
jgi:hypothetical protein